MLNHFPLLTSAEVQQIRSLLDAASWTDGRATAGTQAAQVKNNEQLAPESEASRAAQAIVLAALDRSPEFLATALPRKVFPPRFNRYAGTANHYGRHVDNAVRFAEGGMRVRTDLSCTVFLCEPHEYEGGELVVHETAGNRQVKLAAGHAVLYPGTSVHEVLPVTRGQRLASFFWVESMVRSDAQRKLLLDLDTALIALRTVGESESTIALAGVYHNLLRMWADT